MISEVNILGFRYEDKEGIPPSEHIVVLVLENGERILMAPDFFGKGLLFSTNKDTINHFLDGQDVSWDVVHIRTFK